MNPELGVLPLASLVLCACAVCGGTAPGKTFTVVAFGASTTAPRGETRIFADRLREALAERGVPVRLLNAGIGGNTTEMARQRFERDVLAHQPDLVVIHLGVNDAAWDVWKDPPATGPRVSVARYVENMTHFVREVRARGGKVILVTPQTLCWTPKMKELYGRPPYVPDDPDGFNVVLREYVQALRALAAREEVPLADAFAAFEAWRQASGRPLQDLLPDGMHPSSEGHALIADVLVPEALRLL